MGFVNVEVQTSSAELVKAALERRTALMQAIYPGWKPSPNDVLTIAIEALGPLASDVSQVAARVPEAALIAFGTELLKLPFNEGASATAKTLWTLTDNLGHTIPQGVQVAVGNLGFYVEKEVVVKAGETTAKVQLVAVETGSEYNKLTGPAELIETLDWVKEIAVEGETANGADREATSEYLNRLVAELELQAPRPVNAFDFPSFIRNAPSSILPAGVKVGRTTAKDLYNPETKSETEPFYCTTWATGPKGEALSKAAYEALEAWVLKYLPQNFKAPVLAPVYEKVYVKYKIHVSEGYNPEATIANVNSSLVATISPEKFGNPGAATANANVWVNEPKVRYNTVLGLIESIPGVAYVFPGAEGLTIGTAAKPTGTVDITLAGGPVVLPEVTAETIEAVSG